MYARKKRVILLCLVSCVFVLYLANLVLTKKKIKTSTAVPSRARVYADVLSQKPWNYSYYQGVRLVWRNLDEFQILGKLGEGQYGGVFEARNIRNNEKCAVKLLKAKVPKKWIQRELTILHNLRKSTNIIKLISIAKDKDSPPSNRRSRSFITFSLRRALVYEHVQHIDYTELFDVLTDSDIRFYMFQLLKALDYTHSMGIMHRDVKLQNILIDHKKGRLVLIDWGLAEFYRPGREYSTNVSTNTYRVPEFLLGYQMYDYSLDMWSFGCTLATLIFHQAPFVGDKVELLVNIANVLGTEELFKYSDKYKLKLDNEIIHMKNTSYPRPHARWKRFESSTNLHLMSPAALDLLDHILRIDPAHRYTAREAMDHPYFYVVTKNNVSVTSTILPLKTTKALDVKIN